MPQFTDDATSPFATDEELAAVVAGFDDQVGGSFPLVNVATYGAVGDGVTDDTDAIQAALNAASGAGGGTVFIPVGTFLIESSLSVGESTSLVGAGRLASILSYTGSDYAILVGSDDLAAGDARTGAHLADFRITGTSSGDGGVKIRGATRWTIERLRIHGFTTGYGILLNGCSFIGSIQGTRIVECDIGISAKKQAGDGAAGEGQAFNAIHIGGQCEIQTCTYGIQIGDPVTTETSPVVGMGAEIHGITVEGCTSGGIWNVGGNVINVHDCYLEGNGPFHIRIGSTSGNTSTPVGCSVNANFLYTPASSVAVELLRALHPRVRDNYIVADTSTGNSGVTVAANVTNATVWDNYVNGLGTEFTYGGSGTSFKTTSGARITVPFTTESDLVVRASDFGQVSAGRVGPGNEAGVSFGSGADVNIIRKGSDFLMASGGIGTTQNSAPADGSLAAGDMAIWYDSTNGASKLMVKAKQADGTVKTGQIALA